MDLAYEPLIGVYATTPGDVVGERERVPSREYFADVLLAEGRRFLQDFFNLEVAQAVPLDSRCPVDRSNPRAMPEPFLVLRIEPEVVKEPPQPLNVLERLREASRGDVVVHDERIPLFLSVRAIIRVFLSFVAAERSDQLKRAVTIARRISAPIASWKYPNRRIRAASRGICAAAAASPLAASGPIATSR